jgi:transcriptional regulator with XRE-family HTH domain
MDQSRTISDWMQEMGVTRTELAARSGLDEKVVEAIVAGRYTTGPRHRQRLAEALGVAPEHIRWSAHPDVDHLYGHGPQFGRSP